MSPDELLPRVGGPIGFRLNAFFLEDITHRATTDAFDAQLTNLTDDPSQPKVCLSSDADHQLAQSL